MFVGKSRYAICSKKNLVFLFYIVCKITWIICVNPWALIIHLLTLQVLENMPKLVFKNTIKILQHEVYCFLFLHASLNKCISIKFL